MQISPIACWSVQGHAQYSRIGTETIVVDCNSNLSSCQGCVLPDGDPSWQTSTAVAEQVRLVRLHDDQKLACHPRRLWARWGVHLELYSWCDSGPHHSLRSRSIGWSRRTSYTIVAAPNSNRKDSFLVDRQDVPISAPPYKFPPQDHSGGKPFWHVAELAPNFRLPLRRA